MVFRKVINGIEFKLSTRTNHKYMAKPLKDNDGLYVHFGHKSYGQFADKVGYYANKDHHSKNRRKLYRLRHRAILASNGKPAYTIKYTPAWYSWHYLW